MGEADRRQELINRMREIVAGEVGTAAWDAAVLGFAEALRPATKSTGSARSDQSNDGHVRDGVVMTFGRQKGLSPSELTMHDLNWYIEAVSKSVEDESKSRWLKANMATLEALHAELNSRRSGSEEVADGEIPF